MMKQGTILSIASFFLCSLWGSLSCAEEPSSPPFSFKNDHEALFIRRVVELWEEGDKALAKSEIEKELQTQEGSIAFKDYLKGFLGDLYFKEKEFRLSLECYQNLQDPTLKEKTEKNRLQCFLELKDFEALSRESKVFLEGKAAQEDKEKICFLLGEVFFQRALEPSLKEEEKTSCLQTSENYWEKLVGSSLENEGLEALAKLSVEKKDFVQASERYQKLAAKIPEKEDEFLFQKALSEAQYDKQKALSSFSELCQKGKKYAKEALYNRLLLEFDEKHFDEILAEKESWFSFFPEKEIPYVHFFVAKSYLAKENYQKAKEALEKFLALEEKISEQKEALFLLGECGEALQDISSIEKALAFFEKEFPKEPMVAQLLYWQGLFHQQKGDLVKALQNFEKIEKEFPSFLGREDFLFSYAELAFQEQKWQESHQRFVEFLQAFPFSIFYKTAQQYLLYASLQRTLHQEEGARKVLEEEFACFLEKQRPLKEDQAKEYALLVTKIHFGLSNFETGFKVLLELTQNFPSLLKEGEVHLLLARGYQMARGDLVSFCKEGEKALKLLASLQEKKETHLLLFNGYLEQSKNSPELLASCAEHLFQAENIPYDLVKVSKSNLLWLANYYYERAKLFRTQETLSMERASLLLEKILLKEGSLIALEGEIASLEPEVVKLSDLFLWQKHQEKQITLLQELCKQYSLFPKTLGAKKGRVLWELGKSFLALGNKEKALSSFEELSSLSQEERVFSSFGLLESLRLRLFAEKEKSLQNPSFVKNLQELKSLGVRKKLESEPAHLEAFFDYIALTISVIEENNKEREHLLLLQKMKESFSQGEDVLSLEYCEKRKKFPEKDHLVGAYQALLDAEIYLAKARLSFEEKEKREWIGKAQGIVKDFFQKKEKNPYLEGRIQECKKNLEAISENLK